MLAKIQLTWNFARVNVNLTVCSVTGWHESRLEAHATNYHQ